MGQEKMLLKVSPWLQDQIYFHVFNPTASGTPTLSIPTSATLGLPTLPMNEEGILLEYLMNDRIEGLTEYMKTRFTLLPYKAVNGPVPFTPTDPLYIPTAPGSQPVITGDLYLLVSFPSILSVDINPLVWKDDVSSYIRCFHFSNTSRSVDVPKDVMFIKRTTPPSTLYYKNSGMISYPVAPFASSSTFPGYLSTVNTLSNLYNYNKESGISAHTNNKGSDFTILNSIIKPKFRILSKPNNIKSPVEDKFTFEDGKNTYFVRYLPSAVVVNPYYLIGLDTSSAAAGGFYGIASAGGGPFFKKPAQRSLMDMSGVVTGVISDPITFPGPTIGGPLPDPGSPIGFTGGLGGTPSTGTTSLPGSGGVLVASTPVILGPGLPSGPSGTLSTGLPIGSSTSMGSSGTGTSTPLVSPPYRFYTFYHPHVSDFIRMINTYGINGLMRPDLLTTPSSLAPLVQTFPNAMHFDTVYTPNTAWVNTPYPEDIVDFSYEGAYSLYNWELFFHIPMLMAQRMSDNQQFFDAQKWFHFIFDPTSTTYMKTPPATPDTRRFWKFLPFYDTASTTITTLDQLLADIHAGTTDALNQVTASGNDPFQPFAIARMRRVAFMKNVLMKYLDNLIAWGDNLYMRDTIESINEATNLYIMALNILGRKPVRVPQRITTGTYTFYQLPAVDSIGEASVPLETYIDPGPVTASGTSGTPPPGTSFFFCLPPNDKLLTYWDIVEDRLFKIRHCQNIDGVSQKLPLFDPPIDPALLVQATASGVDINTVLNDLSGVNLPNYRFTYMVQKANEFCNDVKALGSAILSACEKSDGEELAVIRSGQEVSVQSSILLLKQLQITEAQANVEALIKTRDSAQARFDYYSSRTKKNSSEEAQLISMGIATGLQTAEAILQGIAGYTSLVPEFVTTPLAVGATFGGKNLSSNLHSLAGVIGTTAAISNSVGSMAGITGGFDRRWDDWQFQAKTAQLEITQINKQIIAGNIRIQIAQQDYNNQQKLIDNATRIDTLMKTKFTNKDLYDWMKAQLATTYFQAYQLAYNLANKAQKCYGNELPLSVLLKNKAFITPTAWDSLRVGLLAGEKLQYAIRNMENAYITENNRTLELTKHISLAMLNPVEIITLRDTGHCSFDIPEELYDLDYPGHINRVIKSVSISIPCVAGPYTTIPCTLSHAGSYVRRNTSDTPTLIQNIPCSSIATSSAQNDNGMFDFNFRDERYLPFEGAGAISSWELSLSNAGHMTTDPSISLRTFDYNTISDVILHIKYTAIDSGDANFAAARAENVAVKVNNALVGVYPSTSPENIYLPRYFSVKHEFPNEWYKFVNDIATGVPSPILSITLNINQFPFFSQGHFVRGSQLGFAKRMKTGGAFNFDMATTGYAAPAVGTTCTPTTFSTATAISEGNTYLMPLTITPISGSLLSNFDSNVEDIMMVLIYQVANT